MYSKQVGIMVAFLLFTKSAVFAEAQLSKQLLAETISSKVSEGNTYAVTSIVTLNYKTTKKLPSPNGYTMDIELRLSGNIVHFAVPENFSSDFPPPASTRYSLNIFDKGLYSNSPPMAEVTRFYWDFKKGWLIQKVAGTLAVSLCLVKSTNKTLDLTQSDNLATALLTDFDAAYSESDRKEFGITLPTQVISMAKNGITWYSYTYNNNDTEKSVFALALSENHYLKINIRFIDNLTDQSNQWRQEARAVFDKIISSFQIN